VTHRSISTLAGQFLAVVAVLVGCGGSNTKPDAAIDAVPVNLDCPTYCAQIQANCTGANAQYADLAHCNAACASFSVGSSTVNDLSGNTLGCRISHAVAASSAASSATQCMYAGPVGDAIAAVAPAFCSGGDVCASFCTLEIAACGSLDAPLPGNPRDGDNTPLYQFRNMANCMTLCATIANTRPFNAASVGDSLACRWNYAIDAAIAVTPNAAMSCTYTYSDPRGPCTGVATP
jgi:hypothetical protein